MRTFHTTWFAFFLAFFGWFGIAPLMAIVREDLMLTKAEIGNTIYRLRCHHGYRADLNRTLVRPDRFSKGVHVAVDFRLPARHGYRSRPEL